jgi:hypothetical protein
MEDTTKVTKAKSSKKVETSKTSKKKAIVVVESENNDKVIENIQQTVNNLETLETQETQETLETPESQHIENTPHIENNENYIMNSILKIDNLVMSLMHINFKNIDLNVSDKKKFISIFSKINGFKYNIYSKIIINLSNKKKTEENIIENDDTQNYVSNIEDSENSTEKDILLNTLLEIIKIMTFITKSNFKLVSITVDNLLQFKNISRNIDSQIFRIENELIENFGSKKKTSKAKKDAKEVKEPKDTSNHHTNIKKKAHKEVLNFMGLEEDTLVSANEIHSSISNYLNENKTLNSEEILSGKLLDLVQFLFNNGKKIGKIDENEEFPHEFKRTDIFKYRTYAFVTDISTASTASTTSTTTI